LLDDLPWSNGNRDSHSERVGFERGGSRGRGSPAWGDTRGLAPSVGARVASATSNAHPLRQLSPWRKLSAEAWCEGGQPASHVRQGFSRQASHGILLPADAKRPAGSGLRRPKSASADEGRWQAN